MRSIMGSDRNEGAARTLQEPGMEGSDGRHDAGRAVSLDEWLAQLPLLHSWDGGKTWGTGGFQREDFLALGRFCAAQLPAKPRILETGAGNSTIFFLFLAPRRLVSIAPDAALFSRIRAYCEAHGIPTDALQESVEGSEWALPRLALETPDSALFDFALIDGCHNLPMVFLDFFYANYMLRPGGCIMIDDVQLHSSRELANMLIEQPEFEQVADLGKALVFRRKSDARDRRLGEWRSSPYIVRRSKPYVPDSAWSLHGPRSSRLRLLAWLGSRLRLRSRLSQLFRR